MTPAPITTYGRNTHRVRPLRSTNRLAEILVPLVVIAAVLLLVFG
jgi:hypothetical protein